MVPEAAIMSQPGLRATAPPSTVKCRDDLAAETCARGATCKFLRDPICTTMEFAASYCLTCSIVCGPKQGPCLDNDD